MEGKLSERQECGLGRVIGRREGKGRDVELRVVCVGGEGGDVGLGVRSVSVLWIREVNGDGINIHECANEERQYGGNLYVKVWRG